MTAIAVPSAAPVHARRDAIAALARIETRRAFRGPAFWIGLALTGLVTLESRGLDWQSGTYQAAVLGFVPMAGGIFVAGVIAGNRDRGRPDRAHLAEAAALDDSDRAIARLLGLVPLVLVGTGLVIAFAIGSRIEGGFWIGNRPGRTDTALHTVPELLMPILLFVVGACTGVAVGRAFLRRTPVIVVGIVLWFLFLGAYWAMQFAPVVYVAPTQVQPIWVEIDGPATNPSTFPSDWLLADPDNTRDEWQRVLVHEPLTAWHDVYLVGVAVLAAGFAIRSRTGRRLAVIGGVLIAAGVVGQVLVVPDGMDVYIPQ